MYRVLPERKVLVKLIDFGLVQWKRGDEAFNIRSTDKAAKAGTVEAFSPARMAAFDAHGRPGRVVTFDAQKDDVWAVGLMLLSMLSPGNSGRGKNLLAPHIANKDVSKEEKKKQYLSINNEEWRTLVAEAASSKRARLLQDVERSVNALVQAPLMMSGNTLPNPRALSQFGERLQVVLKGMLEPDEAERPTAAEAFNRLLAVMSTARPYGLQDPVEGLEDDGLREAIEAASRMA
jgi:serine/threonine protein kinase